MCYSDEIKKKISDQKIYTPAKPMAGDNIFDYLLQLPELMDKDLGIVHAKFSAWLCYFYTVYGLALADQQQIEKEYTVLYNKTYLSATSAKLKDKNIFTSSNIDVQASYELLVKFKAYIEYLENLKYSYEYGLKAVSREISRRQLNTQVE